MLASKDNGHGPARLALLALLAWRAGEHRLDRYREAFCFAKHSIFIYPCESVQSVSQNLHSTIGCDIFNVKYRDLAAGNSFPQ